MKKALWIIYAVIYLFFIIVGVFFGLLSGGLSFLELVSIFLSAIYLVGLYGYVFRKRFWTAMVWRRFFYLICFGTAGFFLSGIFVDGGGGAADAVFGAIFSMPMIFALYQYSKDDQGFWGRAEEAVKGEVINTLLVNNSVLEVEKQVDQKGAKVRIMKEAGQYIVNITRVDADKTESFENTFNDAARLVLFVEQYTFVNVSDFESKYA